MDVERAVAYASWASCITPMLTANGPTIAIPTWAVSTKFSMKQMLKGWTDRRYEA